MDVTINIEGTPVEVMAKKNYLQQIANNLTKSNLQFISELSGNKGINEKLEAKKTMIKTFI